MADPEHTNGNRQPTVISRERLAEVGQTLTGKQVEVVFRLDHAPVTGIYLGENVDPPFLVFEAQDAYASAENTTGPRSFIRPIFREEVSDIIPAQLPRD